MSGLVYNLIWDVTEVMLNTRPQSHITDSPIQDDVFLYETTQI